HAANGLFSSKTRLNVYYAIFPHLLSSLLLTFFFSIICAISPFLLLLQRQFQPSPTSNTTK
uniref:hypothetical protein n=1 Tax=Prevotella sp. TaxID=59823 RepID=UPI004028EAB4